MIEPKYPGAFETVVNLCDCWDEDALQQERAPIVAAYARTALCHERCCRFLAAAGALLNDSYRIAADYTDAAKITRYAARLAHREFAGSGAAPGRERVRFLSAVTAQGVTVFEETPALLCEHIWLVEDEYGAVSRILLRELREHALAAGLDVISCYCATSPYEKLEHLLIPSIGAAFLTANRHHPFDSLQNARRVHAKRFMDTDGLRTKRQHLSFNRRAVAELLEEASGLLYQAKQEHDVLEEFYTRCVNFERVSEKSEAVISEFLGMCVGNR